MKFPKMPRPNLNFWHVLGIFAGAVGSVAAYKWAFSEKWPNVPILSGIANLI